MTYYPAALEGSTVAVSVCADERGEARPLVVGRSSPALAGRPVATPDGAVSRAEDNEGRAARRARGQVRRYCVANGIQRLLTLTYAAPQPTAVEVVHPHVAGFLRRLREARPDLAYVWALERHQSGALHVHVGLGSNGRKLDARWLARTWGRGFVDIRKIRGRGGRRVSARVVAVYLAKYIGKDGVRLDGGGHRYDVRQGRQPEVVRLVTWERSDALRQLIRLAGGEVPSYVWDSSTAGEDWRGPPVCFVSWG